VDAGRREDGRTLGAALLVVALTFSWGCAKGIYHRVHAGETLYRIGKAYGVPYEELADINDISNPSVIYVGQRIFVPGADRELPVDIIAPASTESYAIAGRVAGSDDPVIAALRLQWPVHGGRVASGFGHRGSSFHDGIDISAPVGTPVKAAQNGIVIYSDILRGYGNVIIVRHLGGVATVYAHNHRNWVKRGDQVMRGQVIACVGTTGRTTGPNLHFEVRRNNVVRDPLGFLPGANRAELHPADAADAGG
jgi:murein DD-endopeptidase MepM/ murein hydrolase activator NlpD